jgi:hypothetical protein
LDNLKKYKGYLESQRSKAEKHPNDSANAFWVAEFANFIYEDIILIGDLLQEIADN